MGKYVPLDWTSGTAPFLNGANLDHIEQGIYQSQTETRSATQTTQQGVASVPTGTFNGQCEGSIGGQSLVNSVVNPNFASGTTGWSVDGGTLSATSKILSVTGNGVSAVPFAYQILNAVYQSGKKVKAGCQRVRVTNSVCTQLKLDLYSSNGVTLLGSYIIANPTINTWYDLSNIISVSGGTAGDKFRFYISHRYADAGTASGKVMEIDGNSGVHAIDLGTSASDPNYNKTNAELNNMIGGVLQNGINNVSGLSLVSTGKNLFDKTKAMTDGYYIVALTGLPTEWNLWFYSDYIDIRNRTAIISSLIETAVIAGAAYYNANKTYISGENNLTIINNGRKLTIPTGAAFVRVSNLITNKETLQLEEGTVSTTYEPYISSTLTPNKVLRSLPNGIKDRIYWVNGECYFEQKVGTQTGGLASGDIVSLTTTDTNHDRVIITKPTDFIGNGVDVHFSGELLFPNFRAGAYATDLLTNIGGVTSNITTQYRLFVAKGTYADLAAARTALAGTVINYQLATSITTKLDLSFRCYENGSFACSGSALNPVIAVTTPTTIAGSVNDSIRGLTQAMRILSEQFQFLNEKNQTFDANNIVTDYRLTNQAGILLYKAVLSGGTTPSYTTLTETYYDNAGNLQYTVTSTLTWVAAYKLDSKVVSSIV